MIWVNNKIILMWHTSGDFIRCIANMGPEPLTTLDSLESVKPRFGFGRDRACAMTYSIVWLAVERQSLLREDLFCNIECKYVEIYESYMCSMLSRQIYLKMVDNERMRSCFHLV